MIKQDNLPTIPKRNLVKMYTRNMQRAEKLLQKLYLHAMEPEKVKMNSTQITAAKAVIDPYLRQMGTLNDHDPSDKQNVTTKEILEAFTNLMESNHRLIVDILRTNPDLKNTIINELKPAPVPSEDDIKSLIESSS